MSRYFLNSLYDGRASLSGKIKYDDPNVFVRLHISRVEDALAVACETSLKAQRAGDIAVIQKLARKATKRSNEELEDAEREDWENRHTDSDREAVGNYGSREEKKMYKPMARLLNFVATYDEPSDPRRFEITSNIEQAEESHTAGFQKFSTDFILCAHGANASTETLWHQRLAFGVLKPSNNQGISSSDPPELIVTQCADYAHLFLAAQPCHLFCVGLLIFGTRFCIGIFDTEGITLSPVHDILDDMQMYIRVVRSLACTLSVYELGFDPTARTLTEWDTQKLTGSSQSYPSIVLSSEGDDTRKWCTVGPPVWISSSFLARGTTVWRVREYVPGNANNTAALEGPYMILQTAWRGPNMPPQEGIYCSMTGPLRGLARLACGGDVMHEGRRMTVRRLRCPGSQKVTPPSQPRESDAESAHVLHRIVLACAARPLWEYSSDLELLLGLRDAIQAHRALAERGIIHADINPGSIMLGEEDSDSDNEGPRGYIMGLGLVIKSHQSGPNSPIRPPPIIYAPRVGEIDTAPFLSRRILRHMYQSERPPTVPQSSDTVESFIAVLIYSIMRGVHRLSCASADDTVRAQGAELLLAVNAAFSRTSTASVILQHIGSSNEILEFPSYTEYRELVSRTMSAALCTLLRDLRVVVAKLMYPLPHEVPEYSLTHDVLISVVEKVITSLEQ